MKRAESPHETAAEGGAGVGGDLDNLPYDVIITLGGGITPNGLPLPWVIARLRDGNIKFDSTDVYHLLLSRVSESQKGRERDRERERETER